MITYLAENTCGADRILGDDEPLEAVIKNPRRLAALDRTGLLDSAPEPAFDRVTRLAVQFLKTPVAVISLVDAYRQFFKSAIGLEIPGTPLSHSLCKYVVARRAPLIVPNARRHPLVCGNPVIESDRIVAYLGIPLMTQDGEAIGSLCAIDHEPRLWTQEDRQILEDLAAMIMSEIALRIVVREQSEAMATAQDAARKMTEFSRAAGKAEVATSILRNIGNVLNSANISLEVAATKVQQLNAPTLTRLAGLLQENTGNLAAFFDSVEGTVFQSFLAQLAEHIADEQAALGAEFNSLRGNLEYVNQLIAMQED